MSSLVQKALLLTGSNGKPIAADIIYDPTAGEHPVIIYAHGFNGFKDWGNFDLIARQFVQAGFTFVKFNFSHSGTTPEQPQDFADLDAFAENNYSKECYDLQQVIDWLHQPANTFNSVIDTQRIGLIGHSMGGGISIITAAGDKRIKGLATWASISECKTPWGSWPEERLKDWKEKGVQYYLNSRTGQQLPMHYQLYEDYRHHSEALDILKAAARIEIPLLICHGINDSSVSPDNARAIHSAQPQSELFLTEGDHVFGRRHPWTETQLPEDMQRVTDKTISFFRSAL